MDTSYIVPSSNMTLEEVYQLYKKGIITISEVEKDHVYIVNYDGILETLIIDGQG